MASKALISAILKDGLFYVEEACLLVDNGLGTHQLFFAPDMASENTDVFNRLITQAVDYAVSMRDEAVINAIRYMPQSNPQNEPSDPYAATAYYAAGADDTSRMGYPSNSGRTFLAAHRAVKAELKVGENFTQAALYEKAIEAMQSLNLGQDSLNRLKDWHESGTFTYAGVKHGVARNEAAVPPDAGTYTATLFDGKVLYGPYMEFAYVVLNQEKLLGFNHMIDAVLARKPELGGKSEQETLQSIQAALADRTQDGHYPTIERWCNLGRAIRVERMAQVSRAPFPSDEVALRNEWQKQHRGIAEAILDHFPDEALNYLHDRKIRFAYTDSDSIDKIYPKQELPGLKKTEVNTTSKSVGGKLSRYKVNFISNGLRDDPPGLSPQEIQQLHHQRAAQTSLHELFHTMFGEMSDKARAQLLKGVEDIADVAKKDLDSKTLLKTISTNTLSQALDYRSGLYPNYRFPVDTRHEEVLCNLYGLGHTELKESATLNQPAIKKLWEEMQAAIQGIDASPVASALADTRFVAQQQSSTVHRI